MNLRLLNIRSTRRLLPTINPKPRIPLPHKLLEIKLILCRETRHQFRLSQGHFISTVDLPELEDFAYTSNNTTLAKIAFTQQ